MSKSIMSLITPSINGNAITYPFGLKFKLNQIIKPGKSVESVLVRTAEENLFYGLFDLKDIDFEIVIDNIGNKRNVRLELINEGKGKKTFYIRSGNKGTLRSLEQNGQHLHFVSQEINDGQVLVAINATNNNHSNYEDVVNKCSRIGFTIELELTSPELMIRSPFPTHGTPITVLIRFVTGELLIQDVNDIYSIEELEHLVAFDEQGNYSPLPPDCSKFIFVKQLLNYQALYMAGIKNGSVIHFLGRFGGVGSFSQSGTVRRQPAEKPKLTVPGERGVVCFNGKTDQTFGSYNRFKANDNIKIKPFTIELRMKSKYSFE